MSTKTVKENVTIKFAGDSGDGMQLTGGLFTSNTALTGSDLATYPDFPAEIRAPAGTIPGVSGFQIHFGSTKIFTPGDDFDVLVAMNAAALKTNLSRLKTNGTIIANTDGFDKKNLRLAKYDEKVDPLDEEALSSYLVFKIPITKMTKDCLADTSLGTKEKERCKNMFVLGFLYWRYNRDMEETIDFLTGKFSKKPEVLAANVAVLKAGYHFGETTETFSGQFEIMPAPLEPGNYRGIMGNEALAMGLITAAQKSGLALFYGSYPITPASDILHSLAAHKEFGVKTFQAEDEIAAICSAIGAAYGGNLSVTGTSGPGLALKGEALGLAMILELPLVICNIQRGGPSTGLPTKTEQADLLQAMYGRNGESPVPVLASRSPGDCFETAIEACRIALQFMTPVIILSDGYIANSSEPWKFPKASDIPAIDVEFAKKASDDTEMYLPYKRDEHLVRPWAIPGTAGLAHRIGGLEKEANTGSVSYDPANHEYMVKVRAERIEKIADHIPTLELESGVAQGDLLVLGWGSTYGTIQGVVSRLLKEGHQLAHAHLRFIHPLPKNLEEILANYKQVLIPEINNGQLSKLIRDKFVIPVQQYNKIQGMPISKSELEHAILQILEMQ